MQSTWLSTLLAWLSPSRHLAWEHAARVGHRRSGLPDWHTAFPWEDAADDELFLYAALITAAHY